MISFSKLIYVLAPILAYIAAGSLKFIINSCKAKTFAFSAVGLGGIPSTHNTVTSTVASLIFFREGLDSPALSVAMCILVIVAVDAMGLRQHIGSHAKLFHDKFKGDPDLTKIRIKIGHTPVEVLAGMILGFCCGFILYYLGSLT